MPGNIWDPLGAISGFLALLLSIVLERKRIAELANSVRAKSVPITEAVKQVFILVIKRVWRALFAILAILILIIWLRDTTLFKLYIWVPTPSWAFSEYGSLIFPITSVVLLVYMLVIEPQIDIKRLEKSRNLFAEGVVEASTRIPVIPIVFYDNAFRCSWVTSPDKACSYFENQGFLRANVNEIENMMENVIRHRTAYKTIFVFIHDVVPENITQVRNSSCTLGRYLGAGGRIVWWGDIPLHLRGWSNQMWEEWAGGPDVLSVNHYIPLIREPQSGESINALWERHDLDSRIKITDAGHAIGMRFAGECKRPAGVDRNTIVYSEIEGDLGLGKKFEGLRWAISWRRVFNKDYPHSGFMQFPSGVSNFTEESVIEEFFRFAVSDFPFVVNK